MLVKNVNNIHVPAYLDEQFFVNALEEGLREIKITVHEIDFEWGSNPGDNYCSSIYRVRVTFERLAAEPLPKEQYSLIVKTIPITEATRFLEDVGVFIKEKITFVDVLPRLEILAKGDKFGATCFYATKTPMQTIVFNDLKVDGFTVASRQDGLDWAHCELILQQLGKFHATSMVLAERDPDIVKRFENGMLCDDTVVKTDTYAQMFGGNLEYLAKVAAQWPGYEKISAKLKHYHNNFKAITSKLALPKKGDRFTVLNHGDLWTANFMYAYDDPKNPNTPTRAIFVDFQLSFYGSPACDLNFFLNTSVKLPLLKQRRDDLVGVYYKSLSKMLEYLHYENVPTLDDLKYELRSRELYGLFALYGFLPIVTMPKDLSGDTSIGGFTDEEFKRKKYERIFANQNLLDHMKYSLKRMDDLGVLDEF